MVATRRGLMIGACAFALMGILAGCGAGANSEANSFDPSDMTIGDGAARVHLVEYASLTCPHCAAFHKEVWPQLKANYIDTGKVRFTFREFPTPPQEVALAGFQLARCGGADANRYFAMIDVIFDQQQAVFAAMEKGALREQLVTIAKTAGLSEQQFETCVADAAGPTRIQATVTKAEKLGVKGTPALFLNGVQLGADALSYAGLAKAIDAKLAGS
jgi:protein-disulfide isomerase